MYATENEAKAFYASLSDRVNADAPKTSSTELGVGPGRPDLMLSGYGRKLVGVELKINRGVLNDAQIEHMTRMAQADTWAQVVVVRCCDPYQDQALARTITTGGWHLRPHLHNWVARVLPFHVHRHLETRNLGNAMPQRARISRAVVKRTLLQAGCASWWPSYWWIDRLEENTDLLCEGQWRIVLDTAPGQAKLHLGFTQRIEDSYGWRSSRGMEGDDLWKPPAYEPGKFAIDLTQETSHGSASVTVADFGHHDTPGFDLAHLLRNPTR